MFRAVADTNIYVSAFVFGGKPARILDLCQSGLFELAISPQIVREVLRTKFCWSRERLALFVTNLLDFTHLVNPAQNLDVIPEDPSDNRILECAVEGNAICVISGDRHLLNLKEFRGIRLVTASQFLDEVQSIASTMP